MKLNIATKINLFVTFMILSAVFTLGLIFVKYEATAIKAELDERAYTIVNNLAYNSEFGVLVGDRESLQRLLEGIIKEKDVMYVLIQNKNGEIIARSGENRTEPTKEFTTSIVTRQIPEGKEEFEFSPVMEEKEEVIGLVKLGVSLSSLQQKTRELQIFIIGITIIVIVLSFLGTFLGISFFITRPFRPLISGIDRIVKGDLTHRVEVESEDEIGDFATSFNQMTQALKESKDELEEYNKTLEQKVEKRTTQLKLAQQQIIQQEKMASVGQLAAGVAHELNNPLGGILGYSQLALEKISKNTAKGLDQDDISIYTQYLKDIVDQSQRSKKIVQQLLKFARASTKEVFGPVEINSLINETLSFTQHHLEMGNVKLINNLALSLPEILGNATQLQQVFTNIILNALQAMPNGGDLKISTELVEEKSHKMIQITLSDTGCGIPQKNLNKVFEPFFTTKEVGEGTGLGLSVSYGIIKDHKGEILVESQEGKGTRFIIQIPILLKKDKRENRKKILQTET